MEHQENVQDKFKKFIAPNVTEKWIKIIHECCFKKKSPHADVGIHSTDLKNSPINFS